VRCVYFDCKPEDEARREAQDQDHRRPANGVGHQVGISDAPVAANLITACQARTPQSAALPVKTVASLWLVGTSEKAAQPCTDVRKQCQSEVLITRRINMTALPAQGQPGHGLNECATRE
jgi:hypothetical protein